MDENMIRLGTAILNGILVFLIGVLVWILISPDSPHYLQTCTISMEGIRMCEYFCDDVMREETLGVRINPEGKIGCVCSVNSASGEWKQVHYERWR